MLNIVLTRIDDRLIHGQVVTAWAKITKGNRIIVVDDDVANDDFMISILKMAAPSSFNINILSVNEASSILKGDENGDRVIILVKNPFTIRSLIEKGVNIKEVNLGGMGAKMGRKQLYRNISISEEEKECFFNMINNGTNVYVQIVPDASSIDFTSLAK